MAFEQHEDEVEDLDLLVELGIKFPSLDEILAVQEEGEDRFLSSQGV